VLYLLHENGDAFLAWLDALSPERLSSFVQMPSVPEPLPFLVGLTFPAMQMRFHTAQIEYIQTIYGDRDWHLPDGERESFPDQQELSLN
jgi:hypothetical protein